MENASGYERGLVDEMETRPLPQAQLEPERYLVRAKFTDEIEVYLTVTGVHKVTPTTVGIDVEMPDYCSSPVAPPFQQNDPTQPVATDYRENFGAAPQQLPKAQPCIGNDPLCPCQDGLACHYRDSGKTKAWPVPERDKLNIEDAMAIGFEMGKQAAMALKPPSPEQSD